MKTAPITWALVTFLLLGAYHVLRFAAAQCVGGGCDAYIPLSAVIPLLGWCAAIVTGVIALRSTVRVAPPGVIGGVTMVTLLGPPIGLFVYRDNPDVFVLLGTLCLAITPLTVVIYSSIAGGRPPRT